MKISKPKIFWNKNIHWFLWPVIAVWKYHQMISIYIFFLKIDFRITINV